ncbi:MAG: glutamate-1-semialdehyde 2,1-aminomutase [Halobacteriales archaeon]
MPEDRSRQLYDRALSSLVGGVNSPVRAGIRPYPFFVERGDGAHVIDADGNRYLDYVMGYGPLLFGHDLPEPVVAAVQSHVAEGPMYGAPTAVEVDLAEFIARHVPSVELVRFVNSGTEATMAAVRLARGVTGRSDVVVMGGGYHGAQPASLVEGSWANPTPSSPGVPAEVTAHVRPVPFNDRDALERVFDAHGDDIAAVLTEPILGNNGVVLPEEGYHEAVREITAEHGALLIWDEVITGFRVGGLGCAQGHFGIEPDVTTFGKVMGGGFPIGAVGGRAELLEAFTPTGDVFQAGTFSGHPVAMAAGLESLRYAAENDVHGHVDRLGRRLREGLREVVAEVAPTYTVAGTGSIFKVLFSRAGPPADSEACAAGCRQDPACDRYDACPKDGRDVDAGETDRWERLFWPAMKERGVFLPPNQFEAQFVSYAHTEADIDRTIEAYREAL